MLREAQRLASDVFRPHAEATDQGSIRDGVTENVQMLAQAGYFGLGIDPEFGGMGANEATRQEYTELLASACGVTAFTQQQLHSGGSFASGATSEELKRELLPQFAAGKLLCGNCLFAFTAFRSPDGHGHKSRRRLSSTGSAPWVTAWSLLDCFVLGAVEETTGGHLYMIVRTRDDNEGLTAGEPLATLVMRASDTVVVNLDNVFVPDKYVLYERPADALRRADFCGITGHVYMPLGCARGSVHYLRTLAAKPGRELLFEIADAFAREIDTCRLEALTWAGTCADLPEYKEHALHARTSSIVLAMRAAHATVTATGGSAHLLTNPPQRLLREAVFYTTMAQTPEVPIGNVRSAHFPRLLGALAF